MRSVQAAAISATIRIVVEDPGLSLLMMAWSAVEPHGFNSSSKVRRSEWNLVGQQNAVESEPNSFRTRNKRDGHILALALMVWNKDVLTLSVALTRQVLIRSAI